MSFDLKTGIPNDMSSTQMKMQTPSGSIKLPPPISGSFNNMNGTLADWSSLPASETTNLWFLNPKNLLWGFIGSAIVSIAIVGWLTFRDQGSLYYSTLNFKGVNWAQGSGGKAIMFLASAISLCLCGWAASCVSSSPLLSNTDKNLIYILYGALLVCNVFTGFAFFKNQNIKAACYSSVVSLAVTGFLAYNVYSSDPMAAYATLGAIGINVFTLYVLWQLKTNNQPVQSGTTH